jgi:cytochrome c biogenesis protein CcdA
VTPLKNEKDGVVRDPLSKIFQKIGITGIASAILTMIFGMVIIIYPLQWEEFRVIIGIFLFFIGLINLIGFILSMVSRYKSMKTYVETETMKEMKDI